MLSIIIPTYNSNENLKSLVNSLVVHDVFQVIVVDDFGSDPVHNCKFDEQDNLVVVRLDSNSGAGKARNIGIGYANRPYLMFVDADDKLDVATLLDILRNMKNVDTATDIFFFKPQSHLMNGEPGTRSNQYEIVVENCIVSGNNDDLRYKFHVPWSKIYKSDFVRGNDIRFDEVVASNDVMFSLFCGLKAKKISVSPTGFYSVQEHANSLTSTDSVYRLAARIQVAVRYNSELSQLGKLEYRVSLIPLLRRTFKCDKKAAFDFLVSGKYNLFRDFFPSRRHMKVLLKK